MWRPEEMMVALGVVIVCVIGTSQPALAEPPVAEEAAFANAEVVVVDVSQLMRDHERLRTGLDAMRQKAAEAREKLRGELAECRKLHDRLVDFRAGTPDYRQIEEMVLQRVMKAHTERLWLLRRLRGQHVAAYANACSEIRTEIEHFRQQHEIGIVLNVCTQTPIAIRPSSVGKAEQTDGRQ